MGRKCCAPGCNSNYDSTKKYITVFNFPSKAREPERRELWIKKIHRSDFNPSDTAVVCINHFDERFLIREDRIKRPDGSELIFPRKKITLTPDAFPSIFPNNPDYISEKLPPKRKDPAERLQNIERKDSEQFNEWCKNDIISCFEDFEQKFSEKTDNNWLHLIKNNYILFFKIKDIDIPQIIVSFKVFRNLSIEMYYGKTVIDINSFKWLLGNEFKCDRWTKFENLLNKLNCYKENSETFGENLSHSMEYLEKCSEDEQCTDENELLVLKFIKQQLSLFSMKKLKYTTDLIFWCAKIYFSYPAAYNLIRNSKMLILPHPSYLRKLTYLCSSASFQSVKSYLKNKADILDEREKTVNLLLDEIYVNPSLNFKAGHLIGMSKNSNFEATTIQAFMISSVLSNYKDIVALFPVRNLNAETLFIYANEVLKMLHECGFMVLSLISDNNRINRNMFTKMCGGEIKSYIQNPYKPDKKIFFLFDSVHLIKAVRNNWLNQTSYEKKIFFPNPDDNSITCANLQNLTDIYEMEKKSIVKLAPKLSQKVLFPNSIERQNVKLALHLFDESNSTALDMCLEKLNDNALGTKLFIDLFSKWWKIVNVKHPEKGVHLNDNSSNPIKSTKDDNYMFLFKFNEWLNQWDKLHTLKADEKKKRGMPGKGGLLSKETFFALKFTTNNLIEIIKYIFETIRPRYILLGKFQTDSLEARFGQYRQMSGGNYNISCMQVFEAERKLKILSLINLHSQQKGNFQLQDLNCNPVVEEIEELEIPDFFYDIFNSNDDIEIEGKTMSVLIFIAGYIAYKVSHKLKCSECISILVKDKTLELDCPDEVYKYLLLTDRGQLKWPQEILVFVTVNAFQIFQKLINKTYENNFLTFPEPKKLIIELTSEKTELLGLDFSTQCHCGNHHAYLFKLCLSGMANILLNNYTKVKNDNRKFTSNKRKLSVLAST